MTELAHAFGRNDNKTRPYFRSFYRIGQIDYEYSDYEIIHAVTELIHQGAAEITITRVIVNASDDDNTPAEQIIIPEEPEEDEAPTMSQPVPAEEPF